MDIILNIENNNAVIKVSDNGPGIPEQYLNKVFDKFFRIPTSNIHNVKGYGLGLSFAFLIVTMHGGSINVINNESGCTFTILIPIQRGLKTKILYIEDEEFLGKIVKDTLEKNKYEVRWEKDGAEVMSSFEVFSPDICVVDIMLPNIDGYTLCSNITWDISRSAYHFPYCKNRNTGPC